MRTITEGTRCALLASKLPHTWWPEASKCFACLHNFTVKDNDGLTPYEKRHSCSFNGHLIPFGALVSFMPSGPRKEKLQKFGPRQVEGMFIGYHMHTGGKWSGDYLIVGKEDYVSTESERDIHVQRVKEVTPEIRSSWRPP